MITHTCRYEASEKISVICFLVQFSLPPFFHPSDYLTVCLLLCVLSVCLSACLPVCLSVCPTIRASVHSYSMYMYVYLLSVCWLGPLACQAVCTRACACARVCLHVCLSSTTLLGFLEFHLLHPLPSPAQRGGPIGVLYRGKGTCW